MEKSSTKFLYGTSALAETAKRHERRMNAQGC